MNRYEMLTSKEEEVLCLIWDNNAPMTAVEISELMEQRGWSKVTALKTVQDLTESGRLEIVGVTRVGKAYPRILYPSCTKNEYFSFDSKLFSTTSTVQFMSISLMHFSKVDLST